MAEFIDLLNIDRHYKTNYRSSGWLSIWDGSVQTFSTLPWCYLQIDGHDTGRHLPVTSKGRPIPPHLQVCVVLRFMASNDFQQTIGDTFNINQGTVSRCVHAVVDALSTHIGNFVHFPTTEEHQRSVKNNFYSVAGFPNVCGCIDSTHIRLLQPAAAGSDSYAYMKRKR